jgi:hypothetical protein
MTIDDINDKDLLQQIRETGYFLQLFDCYRRMWAQALHRQADHGIETGPLEVMQCDSLSMALGHLYIVAKRLRIKWCDEFHSTVGETIALIKGQVELERPMTKGETAMRIIEWASAMLRPKSIEGLKKVLADCVLGNPDELDGAEWDELDWIQFYRGIGEVIKGINDRQHQP